MRLAILALLTAAVSAQTLPPQAPSFTSGSSLVVLPATVVDRDGRLVERLPQDRFTVYDNGRRQPIAVFSNEDTPVAIGLVIDDSRSMGPKKGEVIAAALAFARSSNPQDELFAVAFNDVVQAALGGGARLASDVAGLERALSLLAPDGRTALYDALVDALDYVDHSTLSRKVLVVISDGGDNASAHTLKDVLARARRSNVTIYSVGLFDADDADSNPGVLKTLAQTTGGERYLPQSAGSLMDACQRIAREIRGVYTIGYVPPDRDGAYHRVRIEVAPPDGRRVTVRTRPGYVAAAQVTRR